jgi:hypothetical protein
MLARSVLQSIVLTCCLVKFGIGCCGSDPHPSPLLFLFPPSFPFPLSSFNHSLLPPPTPSSPPSVLQVEIEYTGMRKLTPVENAVKYGGLAAGTSVTTALSAPSTPACGPRSLPPCAVKEIMYRVLPQNLEDFGGNSPQSSRER